MFNLLMFNADWSSRRAVVLLDRMFEYTAEPIKGQFKDDNGPMLDRLTALPCLFCVEGVTEQVAYVGNINKARIVGRNLVLEFAFDADVPLLKNSMIFAHRTELDMSHEMEFSRNHWAVKEADLYKFILRHTRPRRQRPTVFQIPEHENIDRTLVSAMMPFSDGFAAVYGSIQQAADSAGLLCRRADDFWENEAIIQDVVALIDRSRIVICDCTRRNPNVFYEAGIAHTLGRDVILITQNRDDIPFDLRHLRYIHYLDNDEGRAKLATELQARIKSILEH